MTDIVVNVGPLTWILWLLAAMYLAHAAGKE